MGERPAIQSIYGSLAIVNSDRGVFITTSSFSSCAEEFDVRIDNKECTASVQQRTTNEQHRTAEETSKDKLIKILEEQLEEANKSRANLEKLLDQQQQLTLISNRKIEALKLEFEKKEMGKKLVME